MGLTLSTEFLFGITVGVLLVLLSRPLTRMLGQAGRYLPLLILLAALIVGLVIWLGR